MRAAKFDEQMTLVEHLDGEPLKPITFGVAEPFMSTLKVSIYAGILIALPLLLYQLYAFLLPALKPTEKRVMVPFLIMVPVLFIAGVVFSYFVVAPAAAKFLLNFNQTEFNIQVRAQDYYGFLITTLLAMGLIFQIPMAVVAVTRLGIVTPRQIAKNRRYVYLGLFVIAMLLPGTDPVTMLIEAAPLIVLFEFSLILARLTSPGKRGSSAEPEPPGTPAS
jgi:sec-independent protein translocase protein TatC